MSYVDPRLRTRLSLTGGIPGYDNPFGGPQIGTRPGIGGPTPMNQPEPSGTGLLGKLGDVAKRVGGYALDNPELIMAALAMYQNARATSKAERIDDDNRRRTEQENAARSEARNNLLAKLAAPQARRPDLSDVFKTNNPYR